MDRPQLLKMWYFLIFFLIYLFRISLKDTIHSSHEFYCKLKMWYFLIFFFIYLFRISLKNTIHSSQVFYCKYQL